MARAGHQRRRSSLEYRHFRGSLKLFARPSVPSRPVRGAGWRRLFGETSKYEHPRLPGHMGCPIQCISLVGELTGWDRGGRAALPSFPSSILPKGIVNQLLADSQSRRPISISCNVAPEGAKSNRFASTEPYKTRILRLRFSAQPPRQAYRTTDELASGFPGVVIRWDLISMTCLNARLPRCDYSQHGVISGRNTRRCRASIPRAIRTIS